MYTLYWGFKRILFALYTYVLTKMLQNGAKFIQKTPCFKNYMRNLDNSDMHYNVEEVGI